MLKLLSSSFCSLLYSVCPPILVLASIPVIKRASKSEILFVEIGTKLIWFKEFQRQGSFFNEPYVSHEEFLLQLYDESLNDKIGRNKKWKLIIKKRGLNSQLIQLKLLALLLTLLFLTQLSVLKKLLYRQGSGSTTLPFLY